jgi:hypothetical protein
MITVTPTRPAAPICGFTERTAALDWDAATEALHQRGNAVLTSLLDTAECSALARLYRSAETSAFRSRVVMQRHGFGQGEYQYFSYPLPGAVAGLREALYPHLAPVANQWNAAMGIGVRYPARHADFIARCHAAGQVRPTPLLLQYGAGDYNCLHQDLYGEHVFPLQVAILLSRVEVVPLNRGDAVVFAVHHRPVQGTRGPYRVQMRHGVSRLHSGQRHTLGIIFHDAL